MSITVTSMSSTMASIRALSSAGTSAGMSSGAASATASAAAIVATFGSSSGSAVQVYDGSGLLSQIRQIQAAGDADASAYASKTSATTSATGTSTTGPDVTANWASILKTRPELAGVAIGYAFEQGIVNTLSTYA